MAAGLTRIHRTISFSFYNGELFRIVVNYDRSKTEGLSTEDVVEAISAKYGTATKPAAEVIFSSSQVYNDSEVVIARWEDSQYSFNLFRDAGDVHVASIGIWGLTPNPPVDAVLAQGKWLPEGRGEARRPSGPASDCSGRSDW